MNENAIPFFARYLESQNDDLPVQTDIKAGPFKVTTKYPSDGDENVTLKYPSDGDDSGPSA